MKEIWIATSNKHKVEEFEKMFDKFNIKVMSILDLDEEVEIIEDGSTFEENALIKARTLSKLLNKPVIADDSGLEVDAMNGGPGIHSARFLGYDTDYDVKNQYIIKQVKDAKDRSCRFVCAIALVVPNQSEHCFVGKIEGKVHDKIENGNGFGYDPIFFVPELNCCLSQISDEEKNKISHRGRACNKLMEFLSDEK